MTRKRSGQDVGDKRRVCQQHCGRVTWERVFRVLHLFGKRAQLDGKRNGGGFNETPWRLPDKRAADIQHVTSSGVCHDVLPLLVAVTFIG